jgi:hypothetical protein
MDKPIDTGNQHHSHHGDDAIADDLRLMRLNFVNNVTNLLRKLVGL